jgi:hypothetical protein
MVRSKEIQIKAILGRFNGDRVKAVDYCLRTAKEHNKLWDEYMKYFVGLRFGRFGSASEDTCHTTS